MKHVSIRQAMQYVADNPEVPDNDLISLPVWELVSRTLFEVANSPTSNSTRSMRRANVARDIILKRLVGRAAITNVRSLDVTVNGGNFSLSGMWTFNVEPLNTWVVQRYRILNPTVGYSTSTWLMVNGPRFSCRVDMTITKPVFTELVQTESVAPCVRQAV